MGNERETQGEISRRAFFRGLSGTAIGALAVAGVRQPVRAATGFADPAFAVQWRAGEAIAPNFWGPMSTATGGIAEAYQEATGGQRLVQYFDKGRMELTNGSVTNGLLAKEMIAGTVQTGDARYEVRPAPEIPLAGDLDNPGPTYGALGGKAAGLLLAAAARIGTLVTTSVAVDGTVSAGNALPGSGLTAISVYDDATSHNVPAVFARYRDTAGVAQVEMGNLGLHYRRWRYGDTPSLAAPPVTSPDQPGVEEADCLARINAYRVQNMLPPLTISPGLMRTARWLSGDMAAKGYFSHTDSLGRDLTARLQAFGLTGNTAWGENIAAGNASAAETFLQWKNSPDHNENMLRPTFTTIGIGRAPGTLPYPWYWTTDFGNV
ncbi:MAG: CAP domain-containing protein [Thermomicrobia bacterium]|nr:CAP domain-containing protein [Thermomicrobia bacterium]